MILYGLGIDESCPDGYNLKNQIDRIMYDGNWTRIAALRKRCGPGSGSTDRRNRASRLKDIEGEKRLKTMNKAGVKDKTKLYIVSLCLMDVFLFHL